MKPGFRNRCRESVGDPMEPGGKKEGEKDA